MVPTISLMLGIPVPFSNLGTVIADLFDYDPSHSNGSLARMQQKLSALHLNAKQVQRFVREYGKQSNDLPQLELNKLDDDFTLAESQLAELFSMSSSSKNTSNEALFALADRYVDYLGQVRGLCRSVWSKFDLVTMAIGGLIIVCAFLFNILLVCETKSAQLSAVTFVAISAICISGVANLLQLLHPSFIILFTFFTVAAFFITVFILIAKYFFAGIPSANYCFQFVEIFSVLLCCVHSVSMLSNSYVVYEDRTTLYLVHSLLAAMLVTQTSAIFCRHISTVDSVAKRRMPKELPWTLLYVVLWVVALAACIRVSAVFRTCREEQVDCEVSWFAQPLAAILKKFEHFRLARLSVSVISVVSVIAIVTMWLRRCGNLNGLEPLVVAMRYLVPLTGFCLCMYWLVDGFMLHNTAGRLVAAGITALPRLVYVLSLATVVVAAVSPLCLLVLLPQQDSCAEEERLDQLQNVSHEELVAQIYSHVRKNWRSVLKTPDASRPVDNTPVVYGLATVYSSGHIVLLTAVAMVMMLLLGDNMAPSIALWLICETCLLEMHAANVHCWSDVGEEFYIVSNLLLVNAFFIYSCIVMQCFTASWAH